MRKLAKERRLVREFVMLNDRKKELGRDLLAKMCHDQGSRPSQLHHWLRLPVFVEFVDLPRVATHGKDEREAMEDFIPDAP